MTRPLTLSHTSLASRTGWVFCGAKMTMPVESGHMHGGYETGMSARTLSFRPPPKLEPGVLLLSNTKASSEWRDIPARILHGGISFHWMPYTYLGTHRISIRPQRAKTDHQIYALDLPQQLREQIRSRDRTQAIAHPPRHRHHALIHPRARQNHRGSTVRSCPSKNRQSTFIRQSSS